LFTETNEQKFSLGGDGVRRFADSHEEIRFVKVIYAEVEVSRKEGKKAVSSM